MPDNHCYGQQATVTWEVKRKVEIKKPAIICPEVDAGEQRAAAAAGGRCTAIVARQNRRGACPGRFDLRVWRDVINHCFHIVAPFHPDEQAGNACIASSPR
jgi:hypothetical protein